MSVRLTWGYDPSVTITQFVLTKSVNKGITYSALATVPFSVSGANYDRATKLFFYQDNSGGPGDIYSIVATGVNGDSPPSYIIAPADPAPLCIVIGYVQTGFGETDTKIRVHVESVGMGQEKWAKNPAGLLAQNPEALGMLNSSQQVYPNASGIWSVTLVQGTYARVFIPDMDFNWEFQVPELTGPVNIRDIKQLRGASFGGIFPSMNGSRERITVG